jgi:hypothetical protein
MASITDQIKERLPYDAEVPATTQRAYHAVVHLIIPHVGESIEDESDAMEYVSETLRKNFLDWGYVRGLDPETGEALEGDGLDVLQTPIPIVVSSPYVEGSFVYYDKE